MTVRRMREDDLQEADRIMRLAFGTFIDLPDPAWFAGDADFVYTRYRADPSAALVAEATDAPSIRARESGRMVIGFPEIDGGRERTRI